MIIAPDSSLREVAFVVCTALHQIGVTAVLTGGSAATVWAPDAYQSRDCDFIISFARRGAPAEETLAQLGFREQGGTYVHDKNPFTVEFPSGPLSVGDEILKSWETLNENDQLLHLLFPTDSCRDRLTAFGVLGTVPQLVNNLIGSCPQNQSGAVPRTKSQIRNRFATSTRPPASGDSRATAR